MWLDVSAREKHGYMTQTNGSFIPGLGCRKVVRVVPGTSRYLAALPNNQQACTQLGDKMVAILILLAMFTSTTLGEKHCILYANTCVTHCPRGMHPYHTRCDEDTKSQRTCDEPFIYSLGYTCGWSRCDCNGDYLLDEKTYSCVDYNTCTLISKHPRTRRRKHPKLRLPEEDEPI